MHFSKSLANQFLQDGKSKATGSQIENNKIIPIDELLFPDPVEDLLADLADEELEDIHPLLAICMQVICLIMPICYMVLGFPALKKHKRMIEKAEAKYQPGKLLSPIFDSYFNMWMLADAEIEDTGETLIDVVREIVIALGADQSLIDIIQIIKNSYTGVYIYEKEWQEEYILKEIASEKIVQATLDPAFLDEFEQGNIYLLRLITFNDEYVEITTPYMVESSEQNWIKTFSNNGIYQGKKFNFKKYRNFMKKGRSRYYWMNYINNSYSPSIDDALVTIQGTPSI